MKAHGSLVVGLLVTGALSVHMSGRNDEPSVGGSTECLAPVTGSRWAGRAYTRAAVYGATDSTALGWVVGIARAPTGDIAIYDAVGGRVVVLGPDLVEQRRFGGPGEGAGDLAAIPHPIALRHLQWVAAHDDGFHVYTPNHIVGFDTSGVERERLTLPFGPFIYPISMPGVTLTTAGLVFYWVSHAVDGPRRAESWLIERDDIRMVTTVPLPPLPEVQIGVFPGDAQARPLWRAYGDCMFVTDGAHPWILRAHLPSGRMDTLHLPRIVAPPPVDSVPVSSLRASAASREDEDLPVRMSAVPPPTALRMWESMVIDPDGWLWLEPRTSGDAGFKLMYRMHVANGVVERDSVPGVPAAFGPAGVWYAMEFTSVWDGPLIVAYKRVN